MKLYYTPRSHFSRKVRILLDAWSQDIELIDVGNVADDAAATFADNPLMKVPVLIDEDTQVFDSDHIASYLARKFDEEDMFDVLTQDVDALNARAIMNGIMASEVSVILAQRTGIDTSAYTRFDKLLHSMQNGLSWLEESTHVFSPEKPMYLDFHLVCMFDHLVLYELLDMAPYTKTAQIVSALSEVSHITKSAPS